MDKPGDPQELLFYRADLSACDAEYRYTHLRISDLARNRQVRIVRL